MIMLDKNHPANGLKRVTDDARKNLRGNVVVKKLYMVPDFSNDSNLIENYPFTENFVN